MQCGRMVKQPLFAGESGRLLYLCWPQREMLTTVQIVDTDLAIVKESGLGNLGLGKRHR